MRDLILNFSTRKTGYTRKMIDSEFGIEHITALRYNVPNIVECHNCGGVCDIAHCPLKDTETLMQIYGLIKEYDNIHFFVPVYLNMPTAKTIALLSRFSSPNDKFFNREIFKGKNAHIHVIADVSGTQSVANMLLGALNMLGFTLQGRCVREYIRNWKDQKIRGGSVETKKYMPQENFITLSEIKTTLNTKGEN